MSIVLDGTSGLTSPAAVLTTTPLAVTSGGTGVTTKTGPGAVVLGTSPTLTTPTFDSASLATISGTAPLYMCRAWVNFNGTGTVAIRASGNVSSITDNGTGDYTVNFTTALVDANYSVTTCPEESRILTKYFATAPATGSCRVVNQISNTVAVNDPVYAFCAFFR